MIHFFKTFLTNQGKNEDLSNRKCDKISLIFEFSISKLGYMGIFMKIREKRFDPFFKTFLTNQGKNGDEDKKKCKNEFNFEFYLSKVGNMAIFLKI